MSAQRPPRVAGSTAHRTAGRLAACVAVALLGRTVPALAQAPARGTVVTDTVWSQALGSTKALVVYLPPSYATDRSRRYPVAYYLHGAEGDETNWVKLGKLDQVMDSLVAAGMPEMIVAMPDGDDSWYTTYNVLLDLAGCRRLLREGASAERDCVAWPHYDDYIAFDVVRHVDAKYRTVASASGRAIGGLSMGGYGAVTLALQYPRTFSAAASHSGALSPLELAPPRIGRPMFSRAPDDSAAFARMVATYGERLRVTFGGDSASWRARDPATIAARITATGKPLPPIYVDCGTADLLLPQNRAFVETLRARGASVQYHEWPGAHTWEYWRAHAVESLSWIAARIATPSGR